MTIIHAASTPEARPLGADVAVKLAQSPIFLDKHHRGRRLAKRTGDGAFIRLARGIYTSAPRPDLPEWALRDRAAFAHIKAAATAAPPGTVIGYEHAALLHGAPLRDIPDVVHVITPHRTSTTNRPLGRRRHVRSLGESEWTILGGILVTSPTRTAVDCARRCSFVEALVIVDYLLGHIARPDPYRREESQVRLDRAKEALLAILDAESGSRGNPQARLVIEAATGWAQSRLESEARRFCLALGMPQPIGQYHVVTARGDSFTDMGWEFDVDGELAISHLEVDGDVKYTGTSDFRAERHREAEIRALGHASTRVDTDLLGDRSLPAFHRRIAQIVPRSIQRTLAPDPRFMLPWERANAVVSWDDPTLPHARS